MNLYIATGSVNQQVNTLDNPYKLMYMLWFGADAAEDVGNKSINENLA